MKGIKIKQPHLVKPFVEYYRSTLSLVDAVDGDYVEMGFGRGDSAQMIIYLMKHGLIKQRKIWFYDSFEGFPAPTAMDVRDKGEQPYEGQFVANYEFANKLKSESPVPINIVKGFFSDTAATHNGKIAILHLDGDLYESYRDCLNALYDKVPSGGVILFDDYKKPKWPGCTLAIDEFFGDDVERIEEVKIKPNYRRHFIIKK